MEEGGGREKAATLLEVHQSHSANHSAVHTNKHTHSMQPLNFIIKPADRKVRVNWLSFRVIWMSIWKLHYINLERVLTHFHVPVTEFKVVAIIVKTCLQLATEYFSMFVARWL